MVKIPSRALWSEMPRPQDWHPMSFSNLVGGYEPILTTIELDAEMFFDEGLSADRLQQDMDYTETYLRRVRPILAKLEESQNGA